MTTISRPGPTDHGGIAVEGEGSICDFTAGVDLSQPTISHHMAKLKEIGLVESEKRGIWIYYQMRSNLAPKTRRLLAQLID